MESLEFYAELLYKSRQLGGPKEFSKEQVERLYEIRRQMGLPGKHPANLCPNVKDGKPSCHSCGGNCSCGGHGKADAELVSEITKKVMAQLGL
jgi:L-fuculose-phosphate aldolase